MESLIEFFKITGINKVYESIANIALISDIARKVKKVISIGKKGVNFFRKFLYGVFVGDISYHNCCSTVIHDLVFS